MGDREMVKRFREQFKITLEEIRKHEDEHVELNDAAAEKLGEYIAANSDLRKHEKELEKLRERGDSIQNDIDSLLGI